MATEVLQNVQNRLRDLAKERHVRIEQPFLDFDKLHSGFVTASQFSRVLKGILDARLGEKETALLQSEYGDKDGKYVNWRAFVSDIKGTFDPNDFSVPPETKLSKTIDAPSTGSRILHDRLNDNRFGGLQSLLSRICQYVNWYGYDLRECFRQFDIHHVGQISESQFYRSIPGPKDLTEEELTLLVSRYQSLKNPGYVNYLSFVADIERVKASEKCAREGTISKSKGVNLSDQIADREDALQPSLNMIIDRIRFAVHRRGVRVMDFFVDYDKLRHDEVTQAQFVCALLLAIGKEAQLTREEVQMLCNAYAKDTQPGLVAYRKFCRLVDEVNYSPDLEKDPLSYPDLIPVGALGRGIPILSPEEEQRISKLLDEIRAKVHKNRILVYPYFRDYDSGTGITRVITATQFSRVLQFLGLGISEEDSRRLCRKFSDPTSGMVNYPLFCQAIDPTFTAQRYPEDDDYSDPNIRSAQNGHLEPHTVRGHKIRANWEALVTPTIKTAGDDLPIDAVLNRIRHVVLVNRIQLKPWFLDFDKLRSGYVTETQFSRALTNAGITRLAHHELSPSQLMKIANAYSLPGKENHINWVKFVNDIDTVFTLPNLEKYPSIKVPPQETFVQPKPGTANWETATEEMRKEYDDSIDILRRKILERRMNLLPDFLAFDKNHRGYVTQQNLRQLMTMFDFSIPPSGIDAILARHSNDAGFDYRGFLRILDPPSRADTEYKYPERLRSLQLANQIGKQRKEIEPVTRDTEGVLDELKQEIYRHRIRLADAFRDFDKLNHGTLPTTTFRRCMGSLPIVISETALSLIEDRFKTKSPGEINWRGFCEEIERVFQTPHLEKDPLLEAEEYKPVPTIRQNNLSLGVSEKADRAIVRIADKVRQRRLQMSPMFNDFDVTHRQTVSQNQFRRVLVSLDLADMISEDEWSCLYWKYRHPLGVVDNVNYQAFVEDVYRAAGIDPYIP